MSTFCDTIEKLGKDKTETIKMKKLLVSAALFFIVLNLYGQSDYDLIGRNEFAILNSDSITKGKAILKSDAIKSRVSAELLFGKKYSAEREFGEMSKEYVTNIRYDNGLVLNIPEDIRLPLGFHVTSNKYIMLIKDGKAIKVGMTANELKSIFPKSFAKGKRFTSEGGNVDKYAFAVYFTFKRDMKVFIEDAWITFILSSEDGKLEKFYSYQPY